MNREKIEDELSNLKQEGKQIERSGSRNTAEYC